jgi:LPXTG-motif cell wall-anchored protein
VLPRTGNNSGPIVILGLFLLFVGLTLLGLSRRPRPLQG